MMVNTLCVCNKKRKGQWEGKKTQEIKTEKIETIQGYPGGMEGRKLASREINTILQKYVEPRSRR